MPRLHAFEFNDSPACPRFVRESIVEVLGTTLRQGKIYDGVAPVFAEFCERAGADTVLDLCSGSGEPASIFIEALERVGVEPPTFVTSDLFPNLSRMDAVAARHPGRVHVIREAVDATDVPSEIDQPARTIISAFHHFQPDLARGILVDCVAKRRPVFILEPFPRELLRLVSISCSAFFPLLLNPLTAERGRLQKALFTYVIGAIPLAGVWDAIISTCRVYSEAELREMVADSGSGFEWEYREVPYSMGGRAVVFYGVPA